MALYVANVVDQGAPKSKGRVMASNTASGKRGAAALAAAPAGFLIRAAQGAGAGVLTLLGAMRLVEGVGSDAVNTVMTNANIDNLVEGFLAAGAPGGAEIAAAVALFLNAGRGTGRVFGLLAFVAISAAFANGASHGDFTNFLSSAYERVKIFEPLVRSVI